MEVGSVRRVRGMFGACLDLVPNQFWLQWFCGGFDVGVLLGEAVAVC